MTKELMEKYNIVEGEEHTIDQLIALSYLASLNPTANALKESSNKLSDEFNNLNKYKYSRNLNSKNKKIKN